LAEITSRYGRGRQERDCRKSKMLDDLSH
jgi:hypothetical protein